GLVRAAFPKPKDDSEEPLPRIHVIGFEVKEEEDRKKNKQFEKVIKEIGGTYNDVGDKLELETVLRESLQGLRYWVEDNNHQVVGQNEVSKSSAEYKWVGPLRDGLYTLQMRVRGERRFLERKIRIGPGDFLVLNLIPQKNKNSFLFQRDVYARSAADRRGRKPILFPENAQDWQGGVFQKQIKSDRSFEVMTTLEKLDNPSFAAGDEGTPLQVKPALVWYEMKADGFTEPLALRHENL